MYVVQLVVFPQIKLFPALLSLDTSPDSGIGFWYRDHIIEYKCKHKPSEAIPDAGIVIRTSLLMSAILYSSRWQTSDLTAFAFN